MKKMIPLMLFISVTGAGASGLNGTDQVFLANAVRGNNYEIQAARLALRMSSSPAVRRYANMMLTDHQQLGTKVQWAVRNTGSMMPLPKTVTYKQADMLRELQNAGRNFNAVYRKQMVSSHNQTYQLFDRYSRSAHATVGLKTVIRNAKPKVMMHWNHALALPR